MPALSAIHTTIRVLLTRRAYAAMVVAILGLGIGASTAIFAVIDAVLLRSLPYGDPGSLVVAFADGTARGLGAHTATTPGAFSDWRAQSERVFSGVAALRNVSPRITSLDTPVVPLTHAVTANYFDVLGASPIVGRVFRDGEDVPGRDNVVMLSYALWQAKFGGDPSIVGRSIDLDARPYVVVGVMNRDFYTAHIFNVQPDLWIPYSFDAERANRSLRDVIVYGRLRAGVSLSLAQAEVRTIGARVASEHPDTDERWSIALVPLREHVIGSFTRIAALVSIAVALVLLIASANAGNLALARGAERTADLALRVALGASRARLVADLLIESIVLAIGGAAVGFLTALVAIPWLVRLIPVSAGIPFLHRAAVDGRVVACGLVVAVVCAMLSAIPPARHAFQIDIIEGLRRIGRGGGHSTRRWRRVLVATEVALAVVVVASAMLITRTLVSLERVPAGFRADRIAKLRTSLRGDAFDAAAARIAHFDELQRRLGQLPDVASASAVSFEPPTPAGRIAAVTIALPGQDDAAARPAAVSRAVLPTYFETMEIPIVAGRGIDASDRADSLRVAVISQAMARRYFADVNPLGRTFAVAGARPGPLRVVGVVGDVLTAGIDPAAQPTFYVPYAQNPVPVMTMVMRVQRGEPAAVLRQAERIAWSLSPFTNVYAVDTMAQALAQLNWSTRFAAIVLGGFAGLAMILAAAGLYAVISYTVVQRRVEIGLRMALGAGAGRIAAEVMTDGLTTVVAGLAVGNALTLAFTRVLQGMLYGVTPGDPMTLILVSGGIILVATCASLGPALAAARVDPQIALRSPV